MKIFMGKAIIILSIILIVMMGALIATKTYGENDVTMKSLLGVWQQYSEVPWAIQFNKDGTFRTAHTVLRLEKIPIDEGRFKLKGATLSFISNDY